MKSLRTLLAWLLLCCPVLAANELHWDYATGSTLYAVIRNTGGQAWNGSAFITWTPLSSRGTFDVPLTEASGFYAASFPATATGQVSWDIYVQAGGSPDAAADIKVASGGSGYWTGTEFRTLEDLDAPVSEAGGGGTPAQVHNTIPVKAFTAKLGTRADGVIRAYPVLKLTITSEAHIWIDCSSLLSDNIENVTTGTSTDTDAATVDDLGMYEKYVSIVLDTSDATVGDTATITCVVEKIGPVAVDVVIKAP